MDKSKNLLAPLTFADEQPNGEQANKELNKLVFLPVQETLLEHHDELFNETLGMFDGLLTPVMTLNNLLHFYLTHLEGSTTVDTRLLASIHEMTNYFEVVRVLAGEIVYLQGEADKAETYVNQKGGANE